MAQWIRHRSLWETQVWIHCETQMCPCKTLKLLQGHATPGIHSNCKSLWIKASAKWINVNVKVDFFTPWEAHLITWILWIGQSLSTNLFCRAKFWSDWGYVIRWILHDGADFLSWPEKGQCPKGFVLRTWPSVEFQWGCMSLQLHRERKKGAWFTFMVADGCLAVLVKLTCMHRQ